MLFAKTINTKTDHVGAFKTALDDALEVALKNLPLAAIALEMESRAAHFRRVLENQAEARRANPTPTMFDPLTYKPIDAHAQARRAEKARLARELREQQIAYAKSVDERGREDAARRGRL
jgi:hypothetical protein